MITYKKITEIDFSHLKEQSIKEGLLYPNKPLYYIGLYKEKELVGWGGIKMSFPKAILKCDYVVPKHRNKGYATEILKIRLKLLKTLNYKLVEANATPLALNVHLRCGAKIYREYKNKIIKVGYENL